MKFIERRVSGEVSLILICMHLIITSKINGYHSLHPQLIKKSGKLEGPLLFHTNCWVYKIIPL